MVEPDRHDLSGLIHETTTAQAAQMVGSLKEIDEHDVVRHCTRHTGPVAVGLVAVGSMAGVGSVGVGLVGVRAVAVREE
ncbi:hypothetical protein Aple_047980 [Acrocarpospora pleiomorpha]|uniref:Uncharacterized protein n=1 Tax=Acrocarpospora pleiomorpha TaxID=90975 RepID=A0A5M3XQH5_9ACTN|nr:hypothetical protein Aple_047980 [Acrocarpospora pleiomorpha]